jgi:uncharacterized damage-inducible protein DinB
MGKGKASLELDLLLALLDEAYDRTAWHGPNLRGALRGVSAEVAAWEPAPGRNSVWQLALHCAYWKYAVRMRLLGGGKRGSFGRKPSNWPALPARCDAVSWKADVGLLDEEHERLREAVASFPAGRLSERRGKSTAARLIYGIAAHDLYHAGQVRVLIKLSGGKRKGSRS